MNKPWEFEDNLNKWMLAITDPISNTLRNMNLGEKFYTLRDKCNTN